MKSRPFVLLGVNSDPRDSALAAIKKNKLTWQSWDNGGSPRGAISKAWGVTGWPTLYVIDHLGVIREQWVGSPGDKVIDSTLEKLVKAAEAAATAAAKK